MVTTYLTMGNPIAVVPETLEFIMNAPKKLVRQGFVSTQALKENKGISAFDLMQPTGVTHSNPIREGGKLAYDRW